MQTQLLLSLSVLLALFLALLLLYRTLKLRDSFTEIKPQESHSVTHKLLLQKQTPDYLISTVRFFDNEKPLNHYQVILDPLCGLQPLGLTFETSDPNNACECTLQLDRILSELCIRNYDRGRSVRNAVDDLAEIFHGKLIYKPRKKGLN